MAPRIPRHWYAAATDAGFVGGTGMLISHGALNSSHGDHEKPPPLILVVDDNLVNQRIAQLQLEQLGYRVHIVNNGSEAVEAMRVQSYDLVLMDCTMPVMDGYEATMRIRDYDAEHGRRTKIVAMTSQGLASDRERCLESGMDDYLQKPVSKDRLKRMIEKWLSD